MIMFSVRYGGIVFLPAESSITYHFTFRHFLAPLSNPITDHLHQNT